MIEKPILFSGPMVRAILEGHKSQTRRVVKGNPIDMVRFRGTDNQPTGEYGWCSYERVISKHIKPPYPTGTRLWVRETWVNSPDGVVYRATVADHGISECGDFEKWRPSIFMPRRFSRINLLVTDVRCQRVQDITQEDARAEGVDYIPEAPAATTHRAAFAGLWDRINAKRGFPWASNPWVWAYTFEVVL